MVFPGVIRLRRTDFCYLSFTDNINCRLGVYYLSFLLFICFPLILISVCCFFILWLSHYFPQSSVLTFVLRYQLSQMVIYFEIKLMLCISHPYQSKTSTPFSCLSELNVIHGNNADIFLPCPVKHTTSTSYCMAGEL